MHWYPIESSHVLLGGCFVVENLDLLRSLFQADMSHCILSIENLGDLFEGGALGFGEHEVDPDSLDAVPKLEIVLEQISKHSRSGMGLTV